MHSVSFLQYVSHCCLFLTGFSMMHKVVFCLCLCAFILALVLGVLAVRLSPKEGMHWLCLYHILAHCHSAMLMTTWSKTVLSVPLFAFIMSIMLGYHSIYNKMKSFVIYKEALQIMFSLELHAAWQVPAKIHLWPCMSFCTMLWYFLQISLWV